MPMQEGRAPGSHESKSVLARVGGRISRDTAIYIAGSMMVFPFSLIQVAVLTRYLEPAQYGELAILLTTSGLLTILMNIVTITGSLRRTFGFADDDDGDGDGDVDVAAFDLDEQPKDIAQTLAAKRKALTTGFVMTFCQITLLGAPLVAFAPSIAGVLIHDSGQGELVRIGVLSAAAGALFRFTHNTLRMERRPIMFNVIWAIRPALVVALASLFVVQGDGTAGALMGTALGTLALVPVCFFLTRKLYGFKVSFREARIILRLGLARAGMIIGMYAVHHADTLLLSRYATNGQVGLYRVASRIASIPGYFVSAYLMAQLPLERTMLFRAAYDREGTQSARSLMLSYYMIIALVIVTALSITADLLIQIAAPAYHSAASLIPLLAIAHMSYGTFIAVIRLAPVAHGKIARVVLSAGAVVIMVAVYPILVPWLGSYGAALGNIIAMGAVTSLVFWLGSRKHSPIKPDWPRVGRAFTVAVACWAGATRVAESGSFARPLTDTLALLAFPVLLVVVGAVPRSHVKVLANIAVSAWRDASGRHRLPGMLTDLSPRRRAIVEAIVRDRMSVSDVAREEGLTEAEVNARMAQALRILAGRPHCIRPEDATIGEYLLAPDPNAVRDALGHRLLDDGVDPLELHALDEALIILRRRGDSAWKAQQHVVGDLALTGS